MTILLLAGTSEARRLASGLLERGIAVLASLAGVVRDPAALPVRTRVGGFGGAEGFERLLGAERIDAVIDATHPFAARITARTLAICRARGLPHLRLERPCWTFEAGWTPVADVAEAAGRIPADGVAFLATGRQSLPSWVATFRGKAAHLRVIDPPDGPFPLPGGWVVGRPPFDAAAERATFAALGITHLVVKDAGGAEGRGKLEAARDLRLAVLVIRRPERPTGMTVVESVEEALDWAAMLPFRSAP